MAIKIINVMATSLDGKISLEATEPDKNRYSSGFTNDDDKSFVRDQIKSADAIIVGANSIRASGRLWEQKNLKGVYPKWFIFTESGLDKDLDFWSQAKITRYFVSKQKIKCDKNVENIAYSENRPAQYLVDYLNQQDGIETVLLFGGGQINRLFYSENLVDELKITICPFVFAGNTSSNFVDPGLVEPRRLLLNSSQILGNHVFLSYTVQKN